MASIGNGGVAGQSNRSMDGKGSLNVDCLEGGFARVGGKDREKLYEEVSGEVVGGSQVPLLFENGSANAGFGCGTILNDWPVLKEGVGSGHNSSIPVGCSSVTATVVPETQEPFSVNNGGRMNKHTRFLSDDSGSSEFSDSIAEQGEKQESGPAHSPSRLGDDTGPSIFWGPNFFFICKT